MIKIVIADDEKMIRDGLVQTMKWGEMGIEVVGSAGDGEKAFEIIMEKKPHIVLTDVRMPLMNGIELLGRIKKEAPQTLVIMLSGYDEFSYAQQAIKLGAADYLLKPVAAEELERTMKRVVEKIAVEIDEYSTRVKIRTAIEKELENYQNAVLCGRGADAAAWLDAIYGERTIAGAAVGRHKELCVEIVHCVGLLLRNAGADAGEIERIQGHALDAALVGYTTVEEIKDWIYRFTERSSEIAGRLAAESGVSPIKSAVEYIEKHFREKLTVDKVAAAVSLSPNYFSHVFKTSRGESFTELLNRLRIEEAKRLLSEGTRKVYEVADLVGYGDYKYFSTVFKRIVGVSPNYYGRSGA